MSIGIEQAVVRIYHANQVIGSGVLVAAGRILTCAHVISIPLGFSKPPEKMPVEIVSLDFPLAQPNQTLTARIALWNSQQDVVGLELIDALDNEIQPASLVHGSRLWGHPFKAFGFPKGQGYEKGVWVEGEIRGPNAAGWVQLDDIKQTGYFVQQGFSGGPVWDDKLNGVAGIVVTADTTPGVHGALMIPSQVLYRIWPEIPEPIGVLGALHEVQDPPEKYLPRPDDIVAIKELLLGRPEKSTAIVGKSTAVGLQGMGGIGKSVLAAAAVQEIEVRRAFPDGIIWLSFGQEPNLTARQEDLARALGEKEAFKDKWQGKSRLRELLAGKTCLVILDDVWDYRHVIDGFDCLSADCRMLITTRDQGIVTDLKATPYTVDLLSETQSLELLAEWAGQAVNELPAEAKFIVKECGCLPLALAMVGALVQQNPESWAKALRRLEKANLEMIQQQFPNYPYPNLLKAIQVSIDALPEGWRERYLDFAVFPEDATIPTVVLKTYWAPLGLDEDDVEDILNRLVKRSLARRDFQGRVFLHDLQRDYVRKQAGDLRTLHRRLVAAYGEMCKQIIYPTIGTTPSWAKGPNDDYFFAHIAYHLALAEEWRELYQMLCDFDFLETRCRKTSVYDLQKDYRLALEVWKGLDAEKNVLAKFEERVRLEAGKIHQAPNFLFPTLYNYLTWLDAPDGPLHQLCEQARIGRKGWLHSLQNPRPQPPIWLRSLEGHIDRVNAEALASDGRQVVSGSDDKTLKVWELESGRLLRSLVGHAGGVNAVAVTPDGRQVISGSDDKTLKMWELESGRLQRSMEGHTGIVTAVVVTPDGRKVISGSWDHTLKVWDLESGRLLNTLKGHSGRVNSVAITPDGRRVVSGSDDKTLKVWELESGGLLHSLKGHTRRVNVAVVTPDGSQVISGSWDNTVKVWDLESGRLLRSLEGHREGVKAVAVTPNGRQVVSGSWDHTIKVWDLESCRLLRSIEGHSGGVNAVAVTSNGKQVISASDDKAIKVWELESGRQLGSLEGHTNGVTVLEVTPDGSLIISGSWDNTLKVWDLESGRLLRSMEGHYGGVTTLAVTPDGRKVVSGSWDHTLKVWDLKSGQLLRSLGDLSEADINSVAVTPDGRQVVSGSDDKILKVWELESGWLLRSMEGHTGSVTTVKVTPDGNHIISGSWDNTLKVWDLKSGQLLRTMIGHSGNVATLAVTPDGSQIISGSWDKTLKVWDLESGRLLRSFEGHSGGVNAVAITPDGRKVISASDDYTIKVWDLKGGRLLRSIEGHSGGVNAAAITPNGRQIVSGSWDHTLKVWELESVFSVRSLEGHSGPVYDVVLTPDGNQVVSGSWDHDLKVWELKSGKLVSSLIGHTGMVTALAVTPDGRHVVSGSWDKTLKVWELKSGRLLRSLVGHDNWVIAVTVTPDGKRVISGSWDHTLKVWDLENGLLIGTLEGHTGRIFAVAVSPNGRQVVSASDDKTLKVWELENFSLLRSLRGHEGRVKSVILTQDGMRVVSASDDKTLKVWELKSGELLRSMEGHKGKVNAMVLAADGYQILSASDDKTIRLWSLYSGTSQILFWNDAPVTCLTVSKDGHYLTCGDSAGRVWIFEWIQ